VSSRIVIVGAGLAGLAAAHELADAGRQITVLDKGRVPGGRTSTRWRSGFQHDHGAQYFTAHDPRFRERVDAWRRAGVVAPWSPRLLVADADGIRPKNDERERFVGVPGMNAMAADLARGLDVWCGVRVERLERAGTTWLLLGEGGAILAEADAVLVTAPPMQTVPLLTGAPDLAAAAGRAVMQPCYAVMLGLVEPARVDWDGAFVNVGPLSWVARDSSKPGRIGGEAWVLHAEPSWSTEHLDDEPDDVIANLRGALLRLTPGVVWPEIVHAEAHRWRFALPDPVLDEACLVDTGLGLAVAGDWCGGPRVEGAYLSGLAAADRLLGSSRS
jgi:renalase